MCSLCLQTQATAMLWIGMEWNGPYSMLEAMSFPTNYPYAMSCDTPKQLACSISMRLCRVIVKDKIVSRREYFHIQKVTSEDNGGFIEEVGTVGCILLSASDRTGPSRAADWCKQCKQSRKSMMSTILTPESRASLRSNCMIAFKTFA